MSEKTYPAYLVIRRLDDRSEVKRIGVSHLDDRYVGKVMSGLLRNMNTDDYFIDDTEVDKAVEEREA
jgi:hypothetical protein